MRSATLSFFVAAKWLGNLNLVSATYIVLAFGGAFVSVQSRVTPSYEEDVKGTGMPALGQVMTLYDRSKASRPPTPSHAALSVPLIAWSCPIWSSLALLSQPTLCGYNMLRILMSSHMILPHVCHFHEAVYCPRCVVVIVGSF